MSNANEQAQPHVEAKLRDGLHVSTHLYLAVGIAALIGMLVSSFMQASAGLDALKQFGLVNQRADHLDRLKRLLLDAETATRGYLLTRDPDYLRPYGEAVPQIRATMQAIEQDYVNEPDNRSSAAELTKLAKEVTHSLEVPLRQAQHGLPIEKGWLKADDMAMEAYRRQHSKLKQNVLAENAQNVKQSVNGFQNARISTVLLAIASLLLLLLVIAQRQKKEELRERINHLLQVKNERLESEVRHRTEELTNLATYLTDVRETEKLNLARELHDELGALLTAAKLDADWVERKLPDDARELIAQRMTRLRQTLISGIALKRRITNDLRPALLYDLGLIEALKTLGEEFRQGSEIDLTLDMPEAEPELTEAVSLSLFRIVQEALTNIQKYAQARHVSLSLHPTKAAIELSVEDDGVGFDPNSPKLARHGLAGIKHRVFTHGGKLDIRSSPGAGVMIRVVLPV